MLGNFSCFCHLLTFLKINFFKKFFQEHYPSVKQFRPRSGLEVIELEYSLRLKIKRNDWLLADTSPQAANHCAYNFESENELKFYNLDARINILSVSVLTDRGLNCFQRLSAAIYH